MKRRASVRSDEVGVREDAGWMIDRVWKSASSANKRMDGRVFAMAELRRVLR
ncbi:hypothetical protein ACFJIW_10280 [Tahibacter sp. UC22_41]|uniref:hypothetical protein n=1 Tax=Tahibacter sp. UC22_41 TaxID=3350178 RepID=UPI0036D988B1